MPMPRPSEIIGVFLLVIVNVFWVASSELTKYLFIDLDFKRPFFTTYAKSCMFSLFILRYACTFNTSEHKQDSSNSSSSSQAKYAQLESSFSDEDYEVESLTSAEFEPVHLTSSEVDSELEPALLVVDEENHGDGISSPAPSRKSSTTIKSLSAKARRVRFSMFREVRRLPEKIAQDAKLARLPYRPPVLECSGCTSTSLVFNYIFYFAPLWFISSTTYQIALVYSSVSSVNLISTSSSLFVLFLGTIFGHRHSDRFTFTKLFLVLVNISGVAVVSQFSSSFFGSMLSLMSAFCYAAYLLAFSLVASKKGKIDINLMFGVIGFFSLLVCTPIMMVLHVTGVEPQLPPPTTLQMGIVIFNGLMGSLFADYLWLYATLLTNSLISSLSLTLSIPMSMIADSVFRNQPPDMAQILASIPIMISFIGASFVSSINNNNAEKKKSSSKSGSSKVSSKTGKQNVNPLNRVMVDADGGAERAHLMEENEEEL